MESKRVLIAGGSSGIGAACVDQLLTDGWEVISAGRRPPEAARPGLSHVSFDATESEVDLDLPDTLHGVIYCPGTITLKPFKGLGDRDYLSDFEVNCLGAARLLKAAFGALKRADHASVVFFSTVAVQTGLPFHASIAAAKGALEAMARSLAAELAPKIRVNVIAPSLTDTPLAAKLLSDEAKREASAKRHPLQRLGDPQEIASMATFLLGDQAGFITGQTLAMDGGLSRTRGL